MIVEFPTGVEADVLIVSTDVPDPGVTGVGANEQLAPVGSPAEQLRATVLKASPSSVTVTVDVALLPGIVTAGAEAARVKSQTESLNVVVWIRLPEVPVTVTTESPAGVEAEVLTVSIESSSPPPKSSGGANEQLAPVGSPAEQARTTFPEKPRTENTATLVVEFLPGFTKAKSACSVKPSTIKGIVVVCVRLPEVAVTVIVEFPVGVEEEVLIVSVEVPLPPVTVGGMNEQLTPGSPVEQVRATSLLKPLLGVIVIVEVALLLAVIAAGAVAETVKSGAA